MQNHSEHSSRFGGAHLAPLGQLDNCRIADGEPDIRGWNVHTLDGCTAGKVDDLIVDTQARKVRYLDVKLDRKEFGLGEDRHVMVPLSDARLDPRNDDVLLESTTAAQLAKMQAMDRDTMREDEIHVPLRSEQAFVEKRTVPREEVVISKKLVEGSQHVEADLRSEQVDVDRGVQRGDARKRKH